MNNSYTIKNAVITSAVIDIADRGCLQVWLGLDYGDSGAQGFGGYALYLPNGWKHHDQRSGNAGHFLYRCMEIAGVGQWDKMVGRTIRVQASHSEVYAIGHIVKNDWFVPREDFKEATS